MKAIRVLSLLGACVALTLAVGCKESTPADDTTDTTTTDTTSTDTPGQPKLDGAGDGMAIGDE